MQEFEHIEPRKKF